MKFTNWAEEKILLSIAPVITSGAGGMAATSVLGPIGLGITAVKALRGIGAGRRAADKLTKGPQAELNMDLERAAQVGGEQGRVIAQTAWNKFTKTALQYANSGVNEKTAVMQALDPINSPLYKTVSSMLGPEAVQASLPAEYRMMTDTRVASRQAAPTAPRITPGSAGPTGFTSSMLGGQTDSGSLTDMLMRNLPNILSMGAGVVGQIPGGAPAQQVPFPEAPTMPSAPSVPGAPSGPTAPSFMDRILPIGANAGMNVLAAILASRAADNAGDALGDASDTTARSLQEWLQLTREQQTRNSGLLSPYTTVGQTGAERVGQSLSFDEPFNPAINLEDDPGYKARMKAAIDALEASASAKGVVNSGGTRQLVLEKGADIGSQEYQAAYNRNRGEWMDRRDTSNQNFERSYRAADLGRTAAVSQAGIESGDISNLGEALAAIGGVNQGGAQARAAGDIGSANAWQQALQSIGENIFSTWGAASANSGETTYGRRA